MKALLALALASAAAAAQEEPATLAAIVQQMASLQEQVNLVKTENADLRSELAAAKRQGPPNCTVRRFFAGPKPSARRVVRHMLPLDAGRDAGRGNGRGCHPLTGLLSGGTAPISMDTLAPVRMELVKVQHMPTPAPAAAARWAGVRNPIVGAVARERDGPGLQYRVQPCRWPGLRRERDGDALADIGVPHGAGRQPWPHMHH